MDKNIFKNILVPYDDSTNSRRAFNKAVTIANLTGANIILAHVISYNKAVAKVVGSYKGTILEFVNQFLNEATKSAARINVKTDSKILYGNIADELLELMKKQKFDLVVMGRRGTSKITGPSLGSVSNALVQHSKVPVLVVT